MTIISDSAKSTTKAMRITTVAIMRDRPIRSSRSATGSRK